MPVPTTYFVIPDLHGRYDALQAYLRASGFADAEGKVLPGESVLLQLGDLIDRGPQSRVCVQTFIDLQAQAPQRVIVLKGNHEAWALASAWDPKAKALWLRNGGSATLNDYEGHEALLEPGGSHYAWLEKLPLYHVDQNVLFCHAGLGAVRNGKLDPEGLLWDRPPLSRGPYRAVVSGHTPTSSGCIEEKQGIFSCDIGLGHGTEKSLYYLKLELSNNLNSSILSA